MNNKELIKIARNIAADYEVTPQDGHVSFYGKAVVKNDAQGRQVLYSYDTPVLRKEKDGSYTRLWDGWSSTTGRHIYSWAGLRKSDWDKLPIQGVDENTDYQQEYYNKKEILSDEIQSFICNYVISNFGTVLEQNYEITFSNWNFVIECGDKDIDEDIVRQLIRTSEANKKFNNVFKEAKEKALNSFKNKLFILAKISEKAWGNKPNIKDELEYILENIDFLPGQQVEIYRNHEYVEDIPWTRNMWGGGAWG